MAESKFNPAIPSQTLNIPSDTKPKREPKEECFEPSTYNPARWNNLCDSANKEDTKFSSSEKGGIAAGSLLGTYFAIWDSHTDMEGYESDNQEISYLDLALEKPGDAAKKEIKERRRRGEDIASSDEEEYEDFIVKQEDVKIEQQNLDKVKKEENVEVTLDKTKNEENVKATLKVDFADIWGRFRWWQMVGHFKGLYKPDGAPENIWYFGNVAWSRLGSDPDLSDGEEVYEFVEASVGIDTRDTDDFGLAVLITSDDKGQPFLEMLYNDTTSCKRERAKRNVTIDAEPAPAELDYVRILWKKQNQTWSRRPIAISNKERKMLRQDGAVTSLDSPYGGYGSFYDAEEDEVAAGTKRVAEDDSAEEEEDKAKRAKIDY